MTPAVAVSVLAALAACAPTGGRESPSRGGVASQGGQYARPASYDPPGPSHDPWGPWIREASRRFDVPERWVREVMRQESGGRATATSRVGAMGLMQVMPGTYRELQGRHGLGDDPYHPYDSIMAGTAYIREMYELYGSPAFLAAYNAGPRRLEDYLWNSRGLPGETRNYVARIGPQVVGHHPRRRAAPEVYAAAEIPLTIPAGPRRMDGATMLALREQRQAVDPGIQVAQLPPGPVVRMDPIPDGSTNPPPPPVPYQIAAAGPVVRMDPIPDGSTGPAPAPYRAAAGGAVVRMDPIPDGATPEGAARLAEAAAVASAPLSQALAARVARAAAAGPTRLVAPPAPPPAARPGQTRLAAVAAPSPSPRGAPPATAPGTGRGFGLVAAAQASTLPSALRPAAPAAGGGWGIQVGAFGSEAQARSMAGTARDAGAVPGSRAAVSPLAQGRNTLYRARVVGLSQSAAQQLCERMRARGGCFVLSPDAPQG